MKNVCAPDLVERGHFWDLIGILTQRMKMVVYLFEVSTALVSGYVGLEMVSGTEGLANISKHWQPMIRLPLGSPFSFSNIKIEIGKQ